MLASLAAVLWGYSTLARPARVLAALLVLQVFTGVSNVVLEWPIVAAVLHTGGAGAMVVTLVWLLATTRGQSEAERASAYARRFSQ